jgi:RNA polymerase sigma factor (sigma-70 family)
LSVEDQNALVAAAKCGHGEAKERIVEGHEPLIRKHATQVAHRLEAAAEFEDLLQAGRLAIFESVRRFDPGKGVKFTTFAVYRLQGAIRDCVGQHSLKVLRPIRENARKVAKANDELMQRLDRKPTVEEIAQETGLAVLAVEEALNFIATGVVSLDDLPDDPLPDPPRRSKPGTTRGLVDDVLSRIHPPEAGRALLLYEGCGWSYAELTAEFDVSETGLKTRLRRARMQFEELYGGELSGNSTC